MSERRALVTGISGQTASYLAEVLLEQGYTVYGLMRRSSNLNLWRIAHLLDRLKVIEGDLLDDSSLRRALLVSHPHEVYNFASQSHVGVSFLEPVHTSEVTGLGALRLFEAVRLYTNLSDHTRVYQASSSEMFGNAQSSPQTELTPFHPVSPYGCAKLFAHTMAQTYRQAYGMFIACGIAYNHESPRRSEEFVTRKITRTLALIVAGQADVLRLGNTSARRDWSHARDVAEGAWKLLQHPTPEDVIFASGVSNAVQDFYEYAFNYVGLDAQAYVKSEPTLMRPTDIHNLVGHAEKARLLLQWMPRYTFADIVKEMVDADLSAVGCRRPSAPEGSDTPPTVPSEPLAADVSEVKD